MKRVVFFGALFISVVFSSSIFSISYALTPPNPIGPKSPPIPELMPDLDSKTDNPGKISDPNSPQTRSLDLPLPLLSEENNQEKSPSDLPPVIRPSREEIKEKVILELKELERVGYDKAKISFDFPIVINDQVEYFIDYFQSKLRNRFTMWMGRSTRYMAMMQKILREHNLPEDLIYLAMIESGFSTKAYSRAHAAGPWQFIRETGARYGLQVNSWVDERKDPIKSTRAAAQHLSDLFNRFGSWYLAAAGYNAGEGKISRALAMYNASNFWEISADHCHYIKEETKQYVPKMIAAALIAKEPEKYGFSKVPYQSPLTFDEVTVPGNVELKDVAAAVGATVDTIVDLNPELKRWVTPPGTSEYIIRVPEGTRDKLLENYAQLIRPKPRVVYAEHRVKKGERLSSISKRYGVKASVILRANRIKAGNPLNAGLVLLIPKRTGAHGFPSDIESTDHENMDEKISSSRASRPRPGGKSSVVAENKAHEKNGRPLRIRYRIRKGDSLASIAEKFDVDISLIKKWNNVKGGPKIQQGKNLTLFVTKGIPDRDGHKENVRSGKLNLRKTKVESANRAKLVLYTVKRGDNLSEIAQKFNTTPNQIRTWNRLSTKGTIKPGDKLSLKIKRSTVANI